jgi:hypothetical protein
MDKYVHQNQIHLTSSTAQPPQSPTTKLSLNVLLSFKDETSKKNCVLGRLPSHSTPV